MLQEQISLLKIRMNEGLDPMSSEYLSRHTTGNEKPLRCMACLLFFNPSSSEFLRFKCGECNMFIIHESCFNFIGLKMTLDNFMKKNHLCSSQALHSICNYCTKGDPDTILGESELSDLSMIEGDTTFHLSCIFYLK